MDNNKVLIKVQNVFRDILDNEEIVLEEQTTANDIEEWDSLSNIQLVVDIEHEFGIRFNSEEMIKWQNVGDLILSIKSKIS